MRDERWVATLQAMKWYALLLVAAAACGDPTGPSSGVTIELRAQRFSDNLGAGCQLQWRAVASDSGQSITYEIDAVFGGHRTGTFSGDQLVYWDVRSPLSGDTAKWRINGGAWSHEVTASCG